MAIYPVVVQTSAGSPVAEKEEAVMASTSDNGIISKPSNHSVDETVARLVNILQAGSRLCAD